MAIRSYLGSEYDFPDDLAFAGGSPFFNERTGTGYTTEEARNLYGQYLAPATSPPATTTPEPTFPGTTTPMGNIARGAFGSYSDFRNRLNIPRMGNTRVADIIRGRAEKTAEDQIGRFTDIRKTVGAPRLQDTDIDRIIKEGLLDPTTTPSFQLGQRLIGERGRTGREQAGEAIHRAGLGGSGIATRALESVGRQEDIDIGNLALQEGVNTRGAAMTWAPQVENAFQNEIARAFGLEEQGISDLFSLERAGQGDFLSELRMALGQEELAKNRDLKREEIEARLQASLGQGVGQFGAAAIPRLLDILLGKGGGAGGGGGVSSALTGAARQVLQRILGGSGGGDVQGITEALVNAGMSQSQADSLIQQILMEDAGELLDVGQFNPDTFADLIGGGGEDLFGGGGDFSFGEGGDFSDEGLQDLLSDFFEGGGDFADWIGGGGAGAGAISTQIPADVAASTQAAYESILPSGGFLDSIGLGGIAPFLTPLGIVSAGFGAGQLINKLFGAGTTGPEWDKKAAKWVAAKAQEIKANPEAWLTTMERDFGPGGRILGQKLLQGTMSQEEIASILNLPENISPQDLGDAIGTGSFMQASIPGMGAAPEFATFGHGNLKHFIDVNIPAITREQSMLGQGNLSMRQIGQYSGLIGEDADPQTQAYIRDFKDSNGRSPNLREILDFQEWLADRGD